MTQSEMQRRIAEEGWCVIDAVIPPEAVAQVRDSILATVAAHKLPDPRNQLDKVSGLVNFDQSFVPYLAEPRLLGLCKALLGEARARLVHHLHGDASGQCARRVARRLAVQSAKRRARASAVSRRAHARDDDLDADGLYGRNRNADRP